DFLERDGIVAHHLDVGTQLAQVLNEVVGERVVVIDDEDHFLVCAWGPTFSNCARGPTPGRSRSRVRARSGSRLSRACRGSPSSARRGNTGLCLLRERFKVLPVQVPALSRAPAPCRAFLRTPRPGSNPSRC